jgi:flagellar hook-associated protein 2
MATISTLGVGSGLDINGLLEQIVAAERAPTERRLNLKEAEAQAELTAFGTLKGALSSFQSALSSLSSETSFSSSTVSVANKDLLSASTSSIADPGTYSVEVVSLAQKHSLASVATTDIDDVIGTGTLTFKFGTTDHTEPDTYTSFTENTTRSSQSVTITNSNNTLSGVRDAINEADIGVTATIVDDGSGYRLLMTSDRAGFDNSLEVTVDEGGGDAANIDTTGLSQLAFNSDATNSEQTQAAQDSEITVNGLQIFRESNNVKGAIHGVTLDLLSADVGSPTQLTIARNNTDIEANVGSFVSAYNELEGLLTALTKYGGDSGQSGLLIGDSTVRIIKSELRSLVSSSITTTGTFDSLSSIGITTNRDASLSLDSSALSAAMSEDFNSVAELFYAKGVVSDSDVEYISSGSETKEGDFVISISTLATQGLASGENVTGSIVIDSSNDDFSFTVDGYSSGVVSITNATYSDMDDLAQEIQNRINASSTLQNAATSVTVNYSTDHFEVTSDKYGSDSTVVIGTTNSSLGFTASATETTGIDVAGTIGGILATGSGQQLTGSGDLEDLVIEISGTTTGRRGTVNFNRGFAGKLDATISNFLSSTGIFTNETDNLGQELKDVASDRVELEKRIATVEARFRKQFAALDVLIGSLQVTSNFLQQQLDSIPEIQVNR